jgi:hypothetical protein
MTSQINFSSINASYPVPGIDNDSQGFRDNFSAISNALSVAKTELTALQTNAVIKSTLSGTPATVNNNLLGSTISNGLYNNMSGVVYGTVTVLSASVVDVDITNGPLQIYALNGNATLRFVSWPGSNKYCKIRLHIKSTGTVAVPAGSTYTPTLGTENSGTLVYATGFPSLALGTTGKYKVIDVWSFDDGANVFVDYIGEF